MTPVLSRDAQCRLAQLMVFWWGGYGMLHLLWLQSLPRTYEFSSAERDVPDGLVIPLTLVAGLTMLVIGGLAGRFADGRPSRLLGRSGLIALLVLLAVSLLALVRVALGVGPLISGEPGVMDVLTEAWFLVAGLGGLALCWVVSVRRRRLQQHRARNIR